VTRIDSHGTPDHITESMIRSMAMGMEQGVSVASLAGDFRESLSSIRRRFLRATGTTPGRFLACLRMQRSKERLARTDESITGICLSVGYDSLATFSRVFSRMVGLSPSRYRAVVRQIQGGTELGSLGGARTRPVPARVPLESGICISIRTPFSSPIFVAAFASEIPQGSPICCLITSPGAQRALDVDRAASAHISIAAAQEIAASQAGPSDPESIGHLVGRARLPRERSRDVIEITMRPATVLDPPVVFAFKEIAFSPDVEPSCDEGGQMKVSAAATS